MAHNELSQAWWFDSHNRAKPSPWLSSTLSELDEKTKQMLKLIEQDADSFAQRAEMYYKKRPVLVDMLGDLYRTHRSLAEQHDLLKHGAAARHTVFGLSSCTQPRPQTPPTDSKPPSPAAAQAARSSFSVSSSCYDSESEVDDPEQEEEEDEAAPAASEAETESSVSAASRAELEREQMELMRAEMERLREQNAELRRAAEENAALRAELAGKDEEKREVIRQLATSFDMMREENCTLRERIRGSKNSSSSSSSRAFDIKKLTKDLFSARLFTAHCKPSAGPIVAL
ncbi:hypothetical protein ACP4OV_007132 [Aristida adscensionis]